MAEYLVQSTSLEAIADEVRILEGTTDAMSLDTMQSCLSDANTEVNDQSDLITQLANAVNALPNAGDSGLYDKGYNDGYGYGYTEGHSDGYVDGYDEGFNEGYNYGYQDGEYDAFEALSPLIDQAACYWHSDGHDNPIIQFTSVINGDTVTKGHWAGIFAYPTDIYGTNTNYTFDDLIEIESSSTTSDPIVYTINNYSDCYAYLYMRVMEARSEMEWIETWVIPPQSTTSYSYTASTLICDWYTQIHGVRFTMHELSE